MSASGHCPDGPRAARPDWPGEPPPGGEERLLRNPGLQDLVNLVNAVLNISGDVGVPDGPDVVADRGDDLVAQRRVAEVGRVDVNHLEVVDLGAAAYLLLASVLDLHA